MISATKLATCKYNLLHYLAVENLSVALNKEKTNPFEVNNGDTHKIKRIAVLPAGFCGAVGAGVGAPAPGSRGVVLWLLVVGLGRVIVFSATTDFLLAGGFSTCWFIHIDNFVSLLGER